MLLNRQRRGHVFIHCKPLNRDNRQDAYYHKLPSSNRPNPMERGKKKKKKKENDISGNSCGRWHWEERRERPAEGGEQLTRSDTGKRGDLIAQLTKSTGRKQQERLVPSVWLSSPLLLVGPSVAFLRSLYPPTPPLFPQHCCLSRLTTLEQNDRPSPPREHGSSW